MKNIRKIIIIFIISFSIFFTVFSLYFYQVFKSPNVLLNKYNSFFFIYHFNDFKDVQYYLYKNGYVKNIISFNFVSFFIKYDNKIIPGLYLLKNNMSNLDIIKLFEKGIQKPINITFNEISTILDFSEIITRDIEFQSYKFKYLISKYDFINKYGFNLYNIKFMFIPSTYKIYWTITPKKLFNFMNKEYYKFWNINKLDILLKIKIIPIDTSIIFSIIYNKSFKVNNIILDSYMNIIL